MEWAWDDVHGKELKIEDVLAGRKEEVGYMQKRGIWSEVDVEECWRNTGKAPVSVKWVDTDKGTEVRCRLVARDFKGKNEKDRYDLFAATPPLEMKRMLMSKAVTRRYRGGARVIRKMMFIDARKSHLNPRCKEDVYIALPPEVGAEVGKVGKFNFWLYGFRPAAQAWEEHYAERLVVEGFERGEGSAVSFWHRKKDFACAVHGDDFNFEGEEADLWWIRGLMKGWFEIKERRILGPEEKDSKEITILGRIVRWMVWGIEFEADPRHRKLVLEHFGFDEGSRELSVTGAAEEEEEGDDEVLVGEEAREYRGITARLNYLAQDSPELQFPVKEICRGMAKPRRGDWKKLKRVARFLIGRRAVRWEYRWQDGGNKFRVCTESDRAGCKRTQKSSSGGVLMLGRHCLKTWCSTQGALALSSAEAEYYSMVEGVLRAGGMKNVGREIGRDGVDLETTLATDSSAAKGFVSRRGGGRMRHMEVRWLWLQEEVRKGRVKMERISGKINPGDVMTKYLTWKEIEGKLSEMGIRGEFKGR